MKELKYVWNVHTILDFIRQCDLMHIVQTVDVHWQPKQNVFPVNALLGNGEQLFQERKKNRLNKRSMDKNQVRLRKIPLGTFIDALLELYNEGLDFIDIVGTNDAIQDKIGRAHV